MIDVFHMIDPGVNDVGNGDESHEIALIELLCKASKSAYEDYTAADQTEVVVRVLKELKIPSTNENFSKLNFHYGFQYGFSLQHSFSEVTERILKEVKAAAAESMHMEFTDELLANVVIDRENGFLQLTVGGKTITCKNIQTVDVLEV